MSHPQNENYNISPAGLALIKKAEGWYPKAYKDSVGVWTIGWGTTGIEARPGRTITKAQGEKFLAADMVEFENYVKTYVKVPLTQFQFDALVSLCYNIGPGNLKKSTLLTLLNKKNYKGAASQFSRHVRARDRNTNEWSVLPGLVTRRKEEAALFMRDDADDFDDDDLNMEKQEPMSAPWSHEGTVSAEGVTYNDNALQDIITKSDTVKAALSALTGLAAAAASIMDQLAAQPLLAASFAMSATALGAVIWFKYRDTREQR